MLKIYSDLGHSYDLGVGHSCDLPPPKKINKTNSLFFCLLMILRQAKNPQSGRACAPGGSARQEAGDPPPLGRAAGFLASAGRPPSGGRAGDRVHSVKAPGRHRMGWIRQGGEGLGKNSR